jgi:transposase InsO family protein
LSVKKKYKSWGAKKIHALYMKKYSGEYVPCTSTIEEIFKREGFTSKRRRRAVCTQINPVRIKPAKPNELWTMDFKGWWWTSKKERCEPLAVRDDCSKYLLAIEVLEKGDTCFFFCTPRFTNASRKCSKISMSKLIWIDNI